MNQLTQTLSPAASLSSYRRRSGRQEAHFHKLFQRIELAGLVLLLAALNWSLLQGVCNTRLIFIPEPATHGEWWRWFTHPFVHVTWWHLLLDGAAFLLLYRDLQVHPWLQRVLFCLGGAVGSLVICFCADPMLSTRGFCGLSAVAHGLMAVSALNLMRQTHDNLLFRMGFCSFALVTLKCLIEVLTGKMLFTFLYFGMVGDPVAVAHAGGVLGALVTWLLCTRSHGRARTRTDR
jgi:rhomboid family GlyGly-CTERM serine protease